jgi:hypothetical protein
VGKGSLNKKHVVEVSQFLFIQTALLMVALMIWNAIRPTISLEEFDKRTCSVWLALTIHHTIEWFAKRKP